MSDYPDNWNEIATRIKDAAGWRCIRCGHEHDTESGYVLTVHHLDGDKLNSKWWNLAALCQRCHLHIQAKVKMDQVWMFEHSQWFKPYVAGRYAFLMGLLDNPEYVIPNADQLILDFSLIRCVVGYGGLNNGDQ